MSVETRRDDTKKTEDICNKKNLRHLKKLASELNSFVMLMTILFTILLVDGFYFWLINQDFLLLHTVENTASTFHKPLN